MLELMGPAYIIDACVACFSKAQKEQAFKIYVSECVRLACENTAKATGGSYVKAKLSDVFEKREVAISAEEGRASILKKLRGGYKS